MTLALWRMGLGYPNSCVCPTGREMLFLGDNFEIKEIKGKKLKELKGTLPFNLITVYNQKGQSN